jgi:ABC-type transport system involved in cytochrome c biogenesis permease subunit
MRRIVLSMALLAATAAAALGHPSLVPHDHPHALSALAGLDMLLLAALMAGFAAALAGSFRRR